VHAGNLLSRVLYWPLCRAYARHLGDGSADALLRFMCSVEFFRVYGFWPNLLRPVRFSEKVWSRQLHERDSRYTLVSDKWRVREYVAKAVGDNVLVPLLWHGNRPEGIPFDELPQQFVIKANHGCAYNIIVHNKALLDRTQVRRQLNIWLTENYGQDHNLGIEWAYTNIEPHILVEQLLTEDGRIPLDFKFFCFSGRMEYFKIDFERFEDHSTRFFDRNLTPLSLVEVGLRMYAGDVRFPRNLAEMIQIAEALAKEFDFMRVDLYSIGSHTYFGELTAYPGGASDRFSRDDYDYEFGRMWRTPTALGLR
jgi:hypothetical protein